jgi:hypothetical protein
MIFFKNKKKYFKIIFTLAFAFVFLILNMNYASAGDIFPSGEEIKAAIIEGVLHLMQDIGGIVLAIGMSVVETAMSDELYENVFFKGTALLAINTGWGLVRDFVNMFFILILIFVAIATILKINKYSDKKFIVYVVLAALFVNFSKPVTLFVIDISNLAMSFFMSNIREGGASYTSALMNSVGIQKSFSSSTGNTAQVYISWIVEAIFKFIMGIMLLALGLSLIIRLVALWVLIILSPLAFFAIALPGTAIGNIKTTWFNKLTYWCFFGPVMLFFFWLALVLVSAVGVSVNSHGAELQFVQVGTTGFVVGAFKIIIPYAACIYMLFYGFDLSKKIASSAGDGAAWGLGKVGKIAAGVGAVTTLGYGKPFVDNVKAGLKENKEARILSKRAQLGSKSQKAAHEQKLQEEQTKDWDENGIPKNDELKKILEEKPGAEHIIANINPFSGKGSNTTSQLNAKKKAAAMKLAENGGLNAEDGSYSRAYELFKDNPEALNKFESLAKKKNRGAMIEHEIGSNMETVMKKRIADENTARGSVMTTTEENTFKVTEAEKYKKEVYKKHLSKMKLADITAQTGKTDEGPGFLERDNVLNYIREQQTAGDQRFDKVAMRKHMADMDDEEKQAALTPFIN